MFTDGYRTELEGYDYCGDDYKLEEEEQAAEQDAVKAEAWLAAHAGL